MPSRKVRRRRDKLKRHEYEYVVETEEGARAVSEMIQRGPPDPDVVTVGDVEVREVVASA